MAKKKKKKKGRKKALFFRKWSIPRDTGELILKDMAPHTFQGMDYIGGKSLIMVTKGVEAVVCIGWLALGVMLV